ncbi:hypothetical protein GMST_28180 [Geomonas silvestris]|uniref:Uncharacterized protein n=1 Tax=Geomonas silvestris TaxID=2740184 RepID=A0A6V8ML68_9BACT|nr:hypothetical protein GMST_28180 [Geomonas silvestris]
MLVSSDDAAPHENRAGTSRGAANKTFFSCEVDRVGLKKKPKSSRIKHRAGNRFTWFGIPALDAVGENHLWYDRKKV